MPAARGVDHQFDALGPLGFGARGTASFRFTFRLGFSRPPSRYQDHGKDRSECLNARWCV
jgi:hypothetical protein